jgi:4-amino-4-deoxy-L-arabinose transferase-like glycosyltransferase
MQMRSCDDAGQPVSCLTATTVVTLAIAAGFFSLAPFLSRFDFSNGGENMVVASVQEMHRGGPWLVPTLHEESRTKKPPLATWLSALATRKETAARFSDPDPAIRAEAFADFGWQVRWPALVAMCGVIAGTYLLGKQLDGTRLGVISAVVCTSSFFWLKNARLTTTDAQLALWVTIANCFLAWAVLKKRWWPGLIGAGAALGFAMMSKGPVALLQSVLPIVVFMLWRQWRTSTEQVEIAAEKRSILRPALAGLAFFAVVGLSWYVLVLQRNPDIWREWRTEISREDATGLEPSKWYNYITLLGVMFPWTLFLIVGLVASISLAFKMADERQGRIVLAMFLLLVPILVMSLFRDRETRYLIPLLAPASVLCAYGLVELFTTKPRGWLWLVAIVHWIPLLIMAAGLPLLTSPLFAEKAVKSEPWYSLRFAIIAAEVFALLVILSTLLQRRWGMWGLLAGTAVVMLTWNVVLNHGYRASRQGRSALRPLADQILAASPDAKLYSYRADRPIRRAPIDLSIYLTRVIDNLPDPAKLAETSGKRIYLVRQKDAATAADPTALAPKIGGEWRFFNATRVDNSTWYAFISVP